MNILWGSGNTTGVRKLTKNVSLLLRHSELKRETKKCGNQKKKKRIVGVMVKSYLRYSEDTKAKGSPEKSGGGFIKKEMSAWIVS